MPGIVGYCSLNQNAPRQDPKLGMMVASISHQPWYKVIEARSANLCCACVHLGHFDHSVAASTADGKVGVMLNGWLFGWQRGAQRQRDGAPTADAARYCLSLYLEHGTGFVCGLNGQFNLVVWDDRERTVFLINDRYGTRPWQYAHRDGALYFSPEAKAILAAAEIPIRFNERMVVNQLSWGRIWIGHDTFFHDIFMLEPGSILSWSNGKVSSEKYWDYTYRPESVIDDDFIIQVVDTFRRGVTRQTGTGMRYGVCLTGGLDSRSVLAAMAQQTSAAPHAYTWGITDSHDEVSIAHAVADSLGVPWHFQPLTPGDFLSDAARGLFLTEGQDLLVQSYGLKIFSSLREHVDILATGLALDVTLGGSYLSPRLTSGDVTSDGALEYSLDKSAYFSRDECLQLLRLNETASLLDELRDIAAQDWKAGPNADPADQCDRFFLRSRGWRYLFLRQAWQRYFVEDIVPTFDNDFIDCVLRIPAAWRTGHRFYQRFLQALHFGMGEIPYQRTMLPPAAPLEFWEAGAQLEAQREQLYREIWQKTNGRSFIPYQRYYTNYDEWLRRDPNWISTTDDLLLSPNSLICERFVNRDFIVRLIGEHRSAKRNHHQRIIQLMTLEVFLRQFLP
jgi:asparagine synthetase B (glutamine-hydrolysing)